VVEVEIDTAAAVVLVVISQVISVWVPLPLGR
jgi:hypothetical protein